MTEPTDEDDLDLDFLKSEVADYTAEWLDCIKRLEQAVKDLYPIGSLIRCRITGGDNGVWIHAEVTGHCAYSREPHLLRVENVKTKKHRTVDCRPEGYNRVELIRYGPEQPGDWTIPTE